ncbi:MAG: hypothetical protein H0U04_12535 [Rubrobacter sp.]|nr:hypothetical protein [Rubrobacter sp.]
MTERKTKAGFLAVALAVSLPVTVFLNTGVAHACSCAGVPSAEEGLRTSDAVFWGEATNVEGQDLSPDSNPDLGPVAFLGPVTFKVKEYWKGDVPESVVVLGQGMGASCGLDFDKGKSYLVFAYRSGDTGDAPLGTDLCSATGPLTDVEAAPRVLGPPINQLPDTGGPEPAQAPASRAVAAVASVALIALAGALILRQRLRRGR